MKRTMLASACALVLLAGCGNKEEEKVPEQTVSAVRPALKSNELKLVSGQNEQSNPKKYESVNESIVKSVVPFGLKVPTWVPEGYDSFGSFEIQDWGKKEKIGVESNVESTDKKIEDGKYIFYAENFKGSISIHIMQRDYETEMTLDNGMKAYYKGGKSGAEIFWEENEVSYSIIYEVKTNQITQNQLHQVIKMANSVR